MEKAELIESIKANTRTIVDTLNRTLETTLAKLNNPEVTVDELDLHELSYALEQVKIVADQLETGASRLGEIKEKVA